MMNRLSENLKLIRKQRWNLSQDRFAEYLDSSRSKINSYENAGVEPSIEFMLRLQSLTGFTIRELYSKTLEIESIPFQPLHPDQAPVFYAGPPDPTQEHDGQQLLENYHSLLEGKISRLERRIQNLESAVGRVVK